MSDLFNMIRINNEKIMIATQDGELSIHNDENEDKQVFYANKPLIEYLAGKLKSSSSNLTPISDVIENYAIYLLGNGCNTEQEFLDKMRIFTDVDIREHYIRLSALNSHEEEDWKYSDFDCTEVFSHDELHIFMVTYKFIDDIIAKRVDAHPSLVSILEKHIKHESQPLICIINEDVYKSIKPYDRNNVSEKFIFRRGIEFFISNRSFSEYTQSALESDDSSTQSNEYMLYRFVIGRIKKISSDIFNGILLSMNRNEDCMLLQMYELYIGESSANKLAKALCNVIPAIEYLSGKKLSKEAAELVSFRSLGFESLEALSDLFRFRNKPEYMINRYMGTTRDTELLTQKGVFDIQNDRLVYVKPECVELHIRLMECVNKINHAEFDAVDGFDLLPRYVVFDEEKCQYYIEPANLPSPYAEAVRWLLGVARKGYTENPVPKETLLKQYRALILYPDIESDIYSLYKVQDAELCKRLVLSGVELNDDTDSFNNLLNEGIDTPLSNVFDMLSSRCIYFDEPADAVFSEIFSGYYENSSSATSVMYDTSKDAEFCQIVIGLSLCQFHMQDTMFTNYCDGFDWSKLDRYFKSDRCPIDKYILPLYTLSKFLSNALLLSCDLHNITTLIERGGDANTIDIEFRHKVFDIRMVEAEFAYDRADRCI